MLIDVLSMAALISSLVGQVLINKNKKIGFIFWTFSNILWLFVNFLGVPNPSQIVMYIVYTGLNIHGFISWSRTNKKKKESELIETDEHCSI